MKAGTVCVVTGAAGGIGREIVRTLMRKKCVVWALDQDSRALESLCQEAKEQAAELRCRSVDVTQSSQLEETLQIIIQKDRRIHLWVNNAGISMQGEFAMQSPEDFERVMEVNFHAVVKATRLLVLHMESKGGGDIVNMGSIAGFVAAPCLCAYSASKHAVTGFTRALREELRLKQSPVRLFLVSPGFVDTQMISGKSTALEFPAWLRWTLASPVEVAESVVQAVRQGQEEVIPNWNGKLMQGLHTFFPKATRRGAKVLLARSFRDWILNRTLILGLAVGLVTGCTRAPLKDRALAMRPTSAPSLGDDLGRADFLAALDGHLRFLQKQDPETVLWFGGRSLSLGKYLEALRGIPVLAQAHAEDKEFYAAIENAFEFLEVYGNRRWGEVLLTSYFEPVIEGSREAIGAHTTPLLRRPSDLVEVALAKYDDRFADVGTMRGRLFQDPAKKRPVMGPYYSRQEIGAGALRSRKLELAWVEALDAFFMQIQGSGTVLFPDGGRLRLGYADQNGHPYASIGKFLTDSIPLEKMSLFTIESYLRGLNSEEIQNILNKNPSYVFFEKSDSGPRTALGTEVFSGRTVATDARYFPKGALGFLRFKKPVFSGDAEIEPTKWDEVTRFVLDQDTGGAIRGGGRVDLFWGSGDQAKRHAGFVKDPAQLYYLFPKAAAGS